MCCRALVPALLSFFYLTRLLILPIRIYPPLGGMGCVWNSFLDDLRVNEMGIQNWSENIILIDLPAEPQLGDELKAVADIIKDRGDCDVVMDFSAIDIISSSSLSKLLKMRKQLMDCGHQLIFCNVAPATKGIFAVTGLEGIFKVVDDKFVALAGLQLVR
jgi:anti-anti-sigma factor